MKKEIKYNHSKAEQRFYEYMLNKYPDLIITKKGLPDFMVMNKKNEVLGFVEVKRMDLADNLRKEQFIFRKFCEQKSIPYNIWRPGLDKFKNKKTATSIRHKTTIWEI